MTVIEIKPHRCSRKVFETAGVETAHYHGRYTAAWRRPLRCVGIYATGTAGCRLCQSVACSYA